MATIAGMLNGSLAGQAQQIDQPKAMASSSMGNDSNSVSSTISANDFLTLLVTEMKNQDPTANNDPNQYINQLVQVNSLEQLISINQNLATALGVPSDAEPSAQMQSAGHRAIPSVQSTPEAQPTVIKSVQGNLSVPEPKAAARSVAHALEGQSGSNVYQGAIH